MKFAFIQNHHAVFDIGVMCAVFGVSRQGFYAWRSRPESPRAARARELSGQILAVHREVSRRMCGGAIARLIRQIARSTRSVHA